MLDRFRRMDGRRLAVFCAAWACMGTAFAERQAAPLIGVLTLPGLLAATAGAGLILSFLPAREISVAKLFGTIAFCALLGALGAVSAVRIVADYVAAFAGPGAEILAAFVVGALAQVAIPLLVERRAELLGRFLPSRRT